MEHLSSLAIGTHLRQYRIDGILGQGGFGITYLAEDEDLKRKVAIKECFPSMFVSRQGTTVVPTTAQSKPDFDWALSKFLDEATTVAKFKHPGIVQVLQIIKDENNTAYMVLEFIEGRSLDEWLKSLNGPPSENQLRAVAAPLLDVLEAIHKNNYTHRDIAPDNIYIRSNGKPVLLDFGAAKQDLGKHSKTLNLIVKDGYSPPEQYYAEGRQGPWSDIYAFAATLHRAITGKRPVDAMARLDAIHNEEADPLGRLTEVAADGYSQRFLAAVDAGLAPQMKSRPADIESWRQMLFDEAADEYEAAGKTTLAGHGKTGRAKAKPRVGSDAATGGGARAFLWALLGVLGLGILGAGGYFLYQQGESALDTAAWQKASSTDTTQAYNEYLASKPEGRYVRDAKLAVRRIAQPWSRTFGGAGKDAGHGIALAPRGGYVVAGSKTSDGSNGLQGWVAQLSEKGAPLWTREVGAAGPDELFAIRALNDGGVIAAGSNAGQSGDTDSYVVRLDPLGDIVWQKSYGHDGNDAISALAIAPDGNIVLAGKTARSGGSAARALMISPSGDKIWDNIYGDGNDGAFTSVGVRENGEIVAAGYTGNDTENQSSLYFVTLDRQGQVLSQKSTPGGGGDRYSALALLSNGSVALGGQTSKISGSTERMDTILTEQSPDGKLVFPPQLFADPGDDRLAAIDSFSDRSLVAAGLTTSQGHGGADAWLVRLSADGKIQWQKPLGGRGQDGAAAIATLADGGMIVVGTTTSFGAGDSDIWVVRLDKDGQAELR